MRKLLACGVIGIAVFGGALVACSGGSSGGSQQAFCDTLKKDKATFDQLSNQSDLTDTKSFSIVTAAFNDLNSKAPAEIKSDMNTLTKAVNDLGNLTKQFSSAEAKGDFSQLSNLGQSFSDQNKGVDQAEQNVEKFAKDKCGVVLNSDQSSSTSSKSSSSRSSSSRSSSSSLGGLSDLSDLSQLSDLSDFSSFDSALSELSSLSDLNSFNS
jgi:hypothetical protein